MIRNSSFEEEFAHNITNEDCFMEKSSTAGVVFKALAYIVILLVSLVGNVMVLFITYKNKHLRKSINYFVFNMAVSDLFIPLTIMPIKIVEIISASESWKVDNPWILGNILCKLSYFLPDVSLAVSIESLVLISIDRFISAVLPLNTKLESMKARSISIFCTWFIAIAACAPYFCTFRLRKNPWDNNNTYCVSSWSPPFHHETERRYVTAVFITFVLIPICLFVIVYSTIACVLKAKNRQTRRQLSYHHRHREEQFKKIVRMSVAIISSFIICMIPQLIYTLSWLFLLNMNCAFLKVHFPFTALFVLHSWSAVNPFICLIFMKMYRNSLRKILQVSK